MNEISLKTFLPAGDSVTVEMHQQPGDRSCANEAIGGDHWGPVQIYLANVDDATTADGASAGWFKVSEMGLPSNNPEYWVCPEQVSTYTVKLIQGTRRLKC